MKTMTNTDAKGASIQVPDIEFWGNGDMFKLLCKASSEKEGWMKSTKAMEIPGVGCVVQVTTQQVSDTGIIKTVPAVKMEDPSYDPNETVKGYVVAEAVTFVPGVKILEETEEVPGDEGEESTVEVVSRRLVSLNHKEEEKVEEQPSTENPE